MVSRNIKRLLVPLILFHFLFCTQSIYAVDDAILAVVNDSVITFQELNEYLRTLYLQLKAEGKSETQIQKIIDDLPMKGLSNLIEDKLIIQEAKKKGVVVREKIVDEKLTEIRKHYPSEQDFLNSLLQNGLTLTDLKNKITEQYKIKFLVDDEVQSKIFVNPHEVTDYYQQHLNDFRQKERLDLDSIYVSKSKDSQAAKIKAEKALGLLRERQDFTNVAKEYSESPSIGVIAKGEMIPTIENAVFNLKEGETSSLIEVDNGYYVFKVRQKLPATQASLEEVKDHIKEIIFNRKFKEHYQSWVAKLKDQAYIEIKQ